MNSPMPTAIAVADVDREKALMMGIDPSQVYGALGSYLGSTYVNDFNLLGRTFRVTAQAEASERDDPADVANLRVRGPSGEMTPIGSLATLRFSSARSQARTLLGGFDFGNTGGCRRRAWSSRRDGRS